jgi:hypothetical protein
VKPFVARSVVNGFPVLVIEASGGKATVVYYDGRMAHLNVSDLKVESGSREFPAESYGFTGALEASDRQDAPSRELVDELDRELFRRASTYTPGQS